MPLTSLASARRLFATATDKAPTLQQALRALYKRVHPDLFQEHAVARAANEESFKALQEYVRLAGRAGSEGASTRGVYHFCFYLRPAAAPAAGEGPLEDDPVAEATDGPGEGERLEKVEVSLPPPGRHDPGFYASGSRGGSTTSRATRLALTRLLDACGVASSVSDDGGDGLAASRSLRAFIPGAAEEARQRALRRGEGAGAAGAIRAALRLTRGVTVSLAGAAPRSDADTTAALTRLAAALDHLGEKDLRGLALVVGDDQGSSSGDAGSGRLDEGGRLWLTPEGTALDWCRALEGLDVGLARGRAALAAELRGLEAAVAVAAGLGAVLTRGVAPGPAHRAFLERLAAHSRGAGPVAGGQLRELTLLVCGGAAPPSGEAGAQQQQQHVAVAASATPAAIYAAVEARGPAALRALRSARDSAARTEELRTRTARRLRLRRLSRDPELAPARFESACARLLQHSGALRDLLEGLSVRVSAANAVAPDGAAIDIAWDFEV